MSRQRHSSWNRSHGAALNALDVLKLCYNSDAWFTHAPSAVRLRCVFFSTPMLMDLKRSHLHAVAVRPVRSRSGASAAVQRSFPHRVYFCCAARAELKWQRFVFTCIYTLAACFHVVMSCVNTRLMSVLISLRFRVLFCTWLMICFAGHVLVFLFLCEHMAFCLSFLCAMCSHVNCLTHPSCYLIIG